MSEPTLRERTDAFVFRLEHDLAPNHWHEIQSNPAEYGEFSAVFHCLQRSGRDAIFPIPLDTMQHKDAVANSIRTMSKLLDGIVVALITEAWMARDDGTDTAPMDRPDRTECLMMTVETPFYCAVACWEIRRFADKPPELLKTRSTQERDTEHISRFFGAIEKLN